MINDLWGKVLWLLRKWEIPSLVSDHPTLKERYQGHIEAALKFALTIDNFDDLVDPHHLYDCCFGPEPSAFVLKKIAREEKKMSTSYSKDKYARVKSLKNEPLSLLTPRS